MTRNVAQNTRPSFRFLGEGSVYETKLVCYMMTSWSLLAGRLVSFPDGREFVHTSPNTEVTCATNYVRITPEFRYYKELFVIRRAIPLIRLYSALVD